MPARSSIAGTIPNTMRPPGSKSWRPTTKCPDVFFTPKSKIPASGGLAVHHTGTARPVLLRLVPGALRLLRRLSEVLLRQAVGVCGGQEFSGRVPRSQYVDRLREHVLLRLPVDPADVYHADLRLDPL